MTSLITPFTQQLGFMPDAFQLEAMNHLADGHSVVVCSPTGSGKTLVAEYAVYHAVQTGRRIFYTTPLKALSNQKFHDFKQQFGEHNVGLLTGDQSINRDAPILVMTTEIFRNMLYTVRQKYGNELRSGEMANVQYVVLDECHYMNDAQRGTVWEESLIYCPDHLQVIALSATVANAEELTRWMHHIHPETHLVHSDFRPVPLRFFYDDRTKLMPLFEQDGQLNQRLKTLKKGDRYKKNKRDNDPAAMIERLAERNMLPAIVFTFSRAGCDKGAKLCSRLNLVNTSEQLRIEALIKQTLAQMPMLENHPQLSYLRKGFAAHHAGLLPGLKSLVEQLFQQGLIKAVFATETLAAGINMPARTTVIGSLSKRTDEGHRMLHASEFLQMAGRAGRRGMDEIGYVVIAGSPYDSPNDAAKLASSPADALNSQFTPNYGMVLNLLQQGSLDDAQELVMRSFGQFTWRRRMAPLEKELAEHQEHYAQFEDILKRHNLNEHQLVEMFILREKINNHFRQLRTLKNQMKRYGKAKDLIEEVKATQQAIDKLKREMSKFPVEVDHFVSKHKRLDEKVRQSRKEIQRIKRQLEKQDDLYWQQFLNIYLFLKHLGYIDEFDQPTETGKRAGNLRAENIVYINELIESGILYALTPGELAAAACSLTFDSNRDNIECDAQPTNGFKACIKHLFNTAKHFHKEQRQFRIDIPVLFNPSMAGIAQAWAEGEDWQWLTHQTNQGEGDLVRILRRTSDILRQFAHLEGLPEQFTSAARDAYRGIDRAPIKELDWEASETPVQNEDSPSAVSEEDLLAESEQNEDNPSAVSEDERDKPQELNDEEIINDTDVVETVLEDGDFKREEDNAS